LLSPQISNRDPLTDALIRKARNGEVGGNFGTSIAEGEGWRALDIVCTAGPHDRPFEEQHAWASISLVISGVFSYRSDRGSSLMSSGALMLGSVGRGFECSHPHREGDRCLSFQYAQELFDGIALEAGASGAVLHHDRLPPLRKLAPVTARAIAALGGEASFEEIALELAGVVIQIDSETYRDADPSASRDRARIAHAINHLEGHLDEPHTLANLASITGFSRYHFLRTFKRVTGVTPHQWILRARLREAAKRIVASDEAITQIALEVGFQDLSNFIRSFHAEFGNSPRQYRVSRS
jgi:AraC family transcriptional regulator